MPEITLPEVKLPDVKLPDGFRDMNRKDDFVHAARDGQAPEEDQDARRRPVRTSSFRTRSPTGCPAGDARARSCRSSR